MLSSDRSFADLVRAFYVLAPEGEARAEIAKSMGFEWGEGTRGGNVWLSEFRIPQEPVGPEVPMQRESVEAVHAVAEGAQRPLIVPGVAETSAAPVELLPGVQALVHSASEVRRTAPLTEPLIEARRRRALLSETLASPLESEIDVEALGRRIARAEAIDVLPRLMARSFSRGVEVLVDRAESLSPFSDDQQMLLESIRGLIGADRVAVKNFSGDPWIAGAGAKRFWTEWVPPSQPRPILVLSDLGIGSRRVQVERWAAFGEVCAAASCAAAALVPYPAERWPAELGAGLAILEWDRELSVQQIRRVFGRRWAGSG